MQILEDNELLGKVIVMLFLTWILYSILPYVIAGLSVVVVVFIMARFQKK